MVPDAQVWLSDEEVAASQVESETQDDNLVLSQDSEATLVRHTFEALYYYYVSRRG